MNVDVYKNKSEFNITAAEELRKLSLFAPSINSDYYACIQKILYLIYSKCGETESTYLNKLTHLNGSSHKKAIEYLVNYICNKKSAREGNSFKTNIKMLQGFRIDADYTDQEITSTKSYDSKSIRDTILTYLKKI